VKTAVAWFAKNPVAANLLMVFLIGGGLFTIGTVKMELFPEFSLDTVSVRVAYPGASPEEVEEGICIPIEEEVHGISGVKEVRSSASEGLGIVSIEVVPGEDPRRVLDDVKTRVDAIDTFPDLAEKPVIEELLLRRQVLNVAVHGRADEATLKRVAEIVRDEINALDGVSQVELAGTRPYEISIEVSESALRRYGLTFDDVAGAVRRSSLDLSGGSVKTSGGEVLLRTIGQAYVGEEFDQVVVRTHPDGTRILLRDIATVVDGFEDTDQSATFNGLPVAMVQVFRIGDESALAISAAIHEYIEGASARLPEGISLEVWQDNAVWLASRLDLLLRNGLQGLILVFLVLALFLRFRLSFWVTLGIPISFAGVLFVMPQLDQSVNMLSLFAFILVLGIVVDDAIVVGESIYQEHERGHTGEAGAVRGVLAVSVPVVFAVLTTIIAFVPILYLPGALGKFFAVIPVIVIPALLFSLVESQLILPAHLAHESSFGQRLARVAPFSWWVRFQARVARGLQAFRDRVYAPSLAFALEWRYLTLAAGIGVLIVTAGIVQAGKVRFIYFPDVEGDILACQVTMPQGTPAHVTERAVRQIERAGQTLRAELEGNGSSSGDKVFKNALASVGTQPYLAALQEIQNVGSGIVGAHYGEVVVELVPGEEREVASLELVNRWRELCGPIPGAVEVSFNAAVMSAGAPIHFQFTGRDITSLREAANELKASLETYEGVVDVTDSFRGGKEELVLDILPAAEALGLSRSDLARQVRQGFHGEEAQRIQRGRDDVKVMVRYPLADRRTLHSLERMRIRTPQGVEVPFSAVARVESRRGYATIQRNDRKRTVSVMADADLAVTSPNEVVRSIQTDVLPGLLARYPGVTCSLEGQSSDQAETLIAMARYFLIALLAMYGLMAIPFRSYLQPAIIMSAIPFGLVGAVFGHMIMGRDLSMISVLGLAALAGVVVNDSLVLVNFVNNERDSGRTVVEAARVAGIARFRPIVLTSLTTFAGLTPLLLEKSVQAQFLIPMAISLAFGVLFSTLVSLVLVPSGYLILEDLKRIPRWLYGPEPEPVPAGDAS